MTAVAKKLYGSLVFDTNKQEWLLSDLEPHVAIRLKRVFPRIADGQSGKFWMKDTLDVAVDLLWFISRYPVTCSPDDYKKLQTKHETYFAIQSDADRIKLPDYKSTERGGLLPGQVFRNYQKSFLDWAEIVQGGILIDDVGMGKTMSGLGLSTLKNALPLVIVVEPHLQKQWTQKAKSFISGRVHEVKGNTPYDLPDSEIYIFKYTQLKGWVDVLSAGWVKAIAYDEVQGLRHGTTTAKGLASKSILDSIEIKFGLTATLIYGYGFESWNLINMFRPGLLGSESEFIREWCTNVRGKNIVKDPDALGAYLQEQNVILRRTKKMVGQEAKQLAPELYWIEPDTKRLEEAEKLAEQLAITTLTGSFELSGQAAREFDYRLRQLTGIAKAKAVAAWVRMFVESGKPVILFGWHKEVYRIWNEELADLKPLMFTGDESATQKEQSKQDFIDGKSDILIMSLRAGSGTDGLQFRCSTVIHGELDPAPNIHVQATGRVDRDGQEEDVFSFFGVTNYGSDPVMLDMLGLKESQGRGIQDPGSSKEMKQADPERIKNMARDFLKKRKVALPEKETKASVAANREITEDQLSLI